MIRAVNRQGKAPEHREHRAQALVQGLHRMTAMDLVSSNGDWRIRRRLDNNAQAFSSCNAQTMATGAGLTLAARLPLSGLYAQSIQGHFITDRACSRCSPVSRPRTVAVQMRPSAESTEAPEAKQKRQDFLAEREGN